MIQQNAADGKILRQIQEDGTYIYSHHITRPDNSPAWEEVDEVEEPEEQEEES